MDMDDTPKKKPYVKPEVTRIRLDARCAVLGFCKANSSGAAGAGPAVSYCADAFGSPCQSQGS
jgi:hypothetical protein